jgi:prepilin-type N-terminal cleavage/methylation domain-containing protein
MNRRSGFTLFEVLVAIVLTGIVALLAYGTAQAGMDTRERLERFRETVQARMIVRSLLLDALRHPPEGGGLSMNDTLFRMADWTDAAGAPADDLHFFSHGVIEPQGASATWAVSVAVTEAGLRVHAAAIDSTAVLPLDILLPGVHGLNVRVLQRTADSTWHDVWDAPGRVPAAVSLEFFSAPGRVMAPPLVVHAALEPVR